MLFDDACNDSESIKKIKEMNIVKVIIGEERIL